MAKTCPTCGLLNPPEGQRCDCGYDFRTSRGGPAGAVLRYKGVGGWLLWLCLGLTVLSPALTLVMLTKSYSDSAQYFARLPGLATLSVIDTILSLALMAFSIYAGVMLWRIRPGAVATAKIYLLCNLAYHVVASVLPFMVGLPSEVSHGLLKEAVRGTVQSIIGVAIWYSYLNVSRRVRATYVLFESETV